jgi:hypothetical protein
LCCVETLDLPYAGTVAIVTTELCYIVAWVRLAAFAKLAKTALVFRVDFIAVTNPLAADNRNDVACVCSITGAFRFVYVVDVAEVEASVYVARIPGGPRIT